MHQLAHSPLFNEPSIPAISTDANAEKKKKKKAEESIKVQ